MTKPAKDRDKAFHRLHERGSLLLLPNAWDAGSARLMEASGAKAVATTSAGMAWSQGYPDGDALPAAVLVAAVAGIARVVSVPLTVDIEGGYSSDPEQVGQTVAAMISAGAVGINLEDGASSPALLCAKIQAAKQAAAHAGIDLFVNARTDVYLRNLTPPERALGTIIERAGLYRNAGADGIFVPLLAEAAAISQVVAASSLPLNVMVVPNLPPPDELRKLGVCRVSAGSAIAQAAYGIARRAAVDFLKDGGYAAMFEGSAGYAEMNTMFKF